MKSQIKKYKTHGFTVKDIARLCLWKDVKKALIYHYRKPTQETLTRYEEIFEEIKESEFPENITVDKTERVICWCPSDFLSVDILQWYSIYTNKFSLSFRKWAEVANIPIENKTLDYLKREDIVAHFLYEITFYGWHEKDGKKVADQLQKACNEIKSGKGKTIPLSECKEELLAGNVKKSKKKK